VRSPQAAHNKSDEVYEHGLLIQDFNALHLTKPDTPMCALVRIPRSPCLLTSIASLLTCQLDRYHSFTAPEEECDERKKIAQPRMVVSMHACSLSCSVVA
jgi:hypothetical protein